MSQNINERVPSPLPAQAIYADRTGAQTTSAGKSGIIFPNTERIAAMVDLKLKLGKWHFAEVELPPGKTAAEHLQDLVATALTTRLPADTVAKKHDCAFYFLPP